MKVVCPVCKSERTAPILYGYPTPEAFEAAEREEIMLGGCEIFPMQDDYGCYECNFRWSAFSLPGHAITKFRFKMVENGPCTIDTMRTTVFEAFPDGRIIKREYIGRSRKSVFTEKKTIKPIEVKSFFIDFQSAIRLFPAGIIEGQVCDGSSYILQVSYHDGRKKVFQGDVGGGTIDGTAIKFFGQHFEELEDL